MCLGVLARVTEVHLDDGVPVADVQTSDGSLRVSCSFCPEAAPGDDVLLHAGFVVSVLDPERALDARRLRGERAPR